MVWHNFFFKISVWLSNKHLLKTLTRPKNSSHRFLAFQWWDRLCCEVDPGLQQPCGSEFSKLQCHCSRSKRDMKNLKGENLHCASCWKGTLHVASQMFCGCTVLHRMLMVACAHHGTVTIDSTHNTGSFSTKNFESQTWTLLIIEKNSSKSPKRASKWDDKMILRSDNLQKRSGNTLG